MALIPSVCVNPFDVREFARVSTGYSYKPTVYRSQKEFQNPIYVILYAIEASQDTELLKKIAPRKALAEIEHIRKTYTNIEVTKASPDTIIPYLPKDKPILVCGFFGERSVRDLVNNLRENGYENSHVSLEGTCKNP